VGVRRYDVTSDRLVPVPDPGLTNRQTQPASSRIRIGSSCLASGVFGVLVPPGSYTVRLFRVTGSGTAQSLTAVARTSLRVTAS
jgi:hypothetical protein